MPHTHSVDALLLTVRVTAGERTAMDPDKLHADPPSRGVQREHPFVARARALELGCGQAGELVHGLVKQCGGG